MVVTRSGFTARIISRFRPRKPVIAVTSTQRACRQLGILWGVKPVKLEGAYIGNIHGLTDFLVSEGMLHGADVAIFTGALESAKHASNYISIHRIEDLLNAEEKKKGNKIRKNGP